MKNKLLIKSTLSALLVLLVAIHSIAQERVVRGVVQDEEGDPIAKATVMVKGTAHGTSTDQTGGFSLTVGQGATLTVQMLGYLTQDITVGNQSNLRVTLLKNVSELEGVVVTALGLKREERSLGYAVTKVDNEEMTQVATNNWLSTLNGRVAGLSLNGANSGPVNSVRVTLRGDHSLNYGNNEALFVVDGVPIRSGTTATSSSSSYTNSGGDFPVDFGNGASDLNPEDIESVSVLKGPVAAALYGSRAQNGAIIITTKSGRKTKGIGVSVSSTMSAENAGYWPDFQKEYGSGSDMGVKPYNFWTLDPSLIGGSTDFPPRNISRYAWGEKLVPGMMRYQYDGKNWETGQISLTPFEYKEDWFTGIFQTGMTYNNSIEIDGSNGQGTNTRVSINQNKNSWILPNTGMDRKNISFSFESPVSKWIDFKTKVNYYNSGSDNMPMAGYHQTTVMYNLMWGYNTNSMNDWKEEYFEGRFNEINRNSNVSQNGNSLVFAGTGSYNPYRILYEELNSMSKDRVFGFAGLTFDLSDALKGLTLDVKSGLDYSSDFRTQRKPKLTTVWVNGMYREQSFINYEANTDFLFRYQKDMVDSRLSSTFAFGGNNRFVKYQSNTVQLRNLDIPDIYHINNVPTGEYPIASANRHKKVVNSLYGLATLGWDDMYYIDITGRNDWTSTMLRGNRSYFYPSVSASVLLDQVFNFRSALPAISLTKLRLAWANVANDTDPYSLDQYYNASAIGGGYTLPGTIPSPDLKPETSESWELGLDTRLLRDRLGFDITLYSSSYKNQIINVDVDPIVGASALKINAGEISSKGVEVAIYATPVRTANFSWDLNLNWSRNINKLISMNDDFDPATPLETDMGTTVGGRLHVYSYIGEEMYQLYGLGMKRAPEGSYYLGQGGEKVDVSGQMIIDATSGLPSYTTSPDVKIGKVSPEWRGGFSSTLRYKDFSLNMLFSYQWGGRRYSITNGILSYQGKLNNTVEGRLDGIVAPGVNAVSVDADGVGEYQLNNTVTSSIYTYYQALTQDRYNAEAHTFSTSFLKLKELRLNYNLPASLCKRSKILQGASAGIFATNLFSWDKWPQFDPEGGMMTGTNVFSGIEAGAYPMTRSYGVNMRLSF